MSFTRRQWLTLVMFSIADFCSAICVSLQAPFYPAEAEKKGATATEYGLVFGIFELTVFIVSPIYGKNLNLIGPKFMFNTGIFTTGTCSILFGLLDKVEDGSLFIILSFLIRVVEAMGNAGFLTASFAIIAKEFPDHVATTFASLETFFGLGLIVGPTVGGALYQVGGYTLPFVALGAVLFFCAIVTVFVLPSHTDSKQEETSTSKYGILKALRIPAVFLAGFSIVAASISIGFIQATLEPHLRQFNLSPVMMGFMFVINGGMYAITAPVWGWLCDHKCRPKVATACGSIFIIVGFMFIGPAPFIPIDTVYWLCILSLIIHGVGFGAEVVAAFVDAHREAVAHGFPDNLDTYGLISGLWTSTFALGAFIGPSIAGILYDHVGFRFATLFVMIVHAIVGFVVIMFLCCSKEQKPYKKINEEKSIESDYPKQENDYIKDKCENQPLATSYNSSYGSTVGDRRTPNDTTGL